MVSNKKNNYCSFVYAKQDWKDQISSQLNIQIIILQHAITFNRNANVRSTVGLLHMKELQTEPSRIGVLLRSAYITLLVILCRRGKVNCNRAIVLPSLLLPRYHCSKFIKMLTEGLHIDYFQLTH